MQEYTGTMHTSGRFGDRLEILGGRPQGRSRAEARRYESGSPVNVGGAERLATAASGAALAAFGFSQRGLSGFAMAVAGGVLLYRGLSGHCGLYQKLGIDTANGQERVRHHLHGAKDVEEAIVVDRPAHQVFAFWRNLENLPKFMRHLEQVDQITEKRSHWVASGPAGTRADWNADIIHEVENEIIAWQSIPGSRVETAGRVRFDKLGGDKTRVHVRLRYSPPGGRAGIAVASFFGYDAQRQVRNDLREFKALVESREPIGR